ncbi:hypothetical protein ACFSHP_13955 [Novosphingobium panipatense]
MPSPSRPHRPPECRPGQARVRGRAWPARPGAFITGVIADLRQVRDKQDEIEHGDSDYPGWHPARQALTGAQERLLKEGSLADTAIQAQPREYYAAMRRADPIHFDARLGSWLVTRHEDISAIQSDPVTFSVQHGYSEQQARGMRNEFETYLREHGGGYFRTRSCRILRTTRVFAS